MPDPSLRRFHPAVARWFLQHVGRPTPVQREVWPLAADGVHLLATAPTGSGKTLAAFLWAIDQLCTGAWPADRVALCYLSPLKALGTDVRRNLLEPLAAIRQCLVDAGLDPPLVDVLVRSGDTPQAERQRMLKRPPAILVTTPESLNLLLLSGGGRKMLASVRCLVLDEIHAVVGNKRGTWLMTGVERLDRLVTAHGGALQRLALSATVQPLETVSTFVGGFEPSGQARRVQIVAPPSTKVLDVSVWDPAAAPRPEGALRPDQAPQPLEPDDDAYWPTLTRAFRTVLAANRSTLFFANSRRMAEKVARMLNTGEPEPIAWAHHGSLSRTLRQEVESRLKAGEIKALCATSSLELGIDIGALDEVVLLQAPRSVASCIQRVGRAGHQVGAVSRGTLVPMHGRDLVCCAVLAPLVVAGRSEALHPVRAPLDVLAQVVLSLCETEAWQPDALFAFLQQAAPYRTLTRPGFDLVLDLLRGRYADTRVRALTPRLRQDETTGALTTRPGVRLLLALSGGVIPDRGTYTVRVEGTGARIGEVDEEFVWERHLGDEFAIGTQSWRITAITHDDVRVVPGGRPGAMTPFWRAEAEERGFDLSVAMGQFLQDVEPRLTDPDLVDDLLHRQRLERHTALRLVEFLKKQQRLTKLLPHRRRLVVETTVDPSASTGDERQVIVHAPWGGRLLRPWSLALGAVLAARGEDWRLSVTDDCLGMQPPGTVPGAADVVALLHAVTAGNLEDLLRQRLAGTGFFGAQFRQCAARALLLPRARPGRRMPLWQTRERAKQLLVAVAPYGDFPIVAETWRTCLEDAFELEPLRQMLAELQDGQIEVHEVTTPMPSPMAEGLVWTTTNTAMYADDTPLGAGLPLHERVLRAVAASDTERPRLQRAVVADLEARLQRTRPGYAPGDPDGLYDLVKERVLLAEAEWRALLAAVERDHAVDPQTWLQAPPLDGRMLRLRLPGASEAVVAARALLPDLGRAFPGLQANTLDGRAVPVPEAPPADPLPLLRAWTHAHGPVDLGRAAALWGAIEVGNRFGRLAQAGDGVVAELTEDAAGPQYCDTENLHRLLRLQRAALRPAFRPLPLPHLAAFRLAWQAPDGKAQADGARRVQAALEPLFGLPAAATAWEEAILPARVPGYLPGWLDELLQVTDLCWYGAGPRQIAFAPRSALALYRTPPAADAVDADLAQQLLPDAGARYDLAAIQARTGRPVADLAAQLWHLTWQGLVAAEGLHGLRQAALADFTVPQGEPRLQRRLDRGLQTGRLWPGAWYRLPPEPPAATPLEAAERDKERVRQLADRHGVLCREVLTQEPPLLAWGRLLPTLRLLELAGELVAGPFFDDLPGLQFATPAAVRRLQEPEDAAVRWHVATDPASVCGLGLPVPGLPSRLPTTTLVWHGRRLVLVARRGGRLLEPHVAADDPHLPRYLACLAEPVQRAVRPDKAVVVEVVGTEPAATGAFRHALKAAGFQADFKSMVLRRSY